METSLVVVFIFLNVIDIFLPYLYGSLKCNFITKIFNREFQLTTLISLVNLYLHITILTIYIHCK